MNQSSTHILVVDDHSEIRDLLKRFLEQHGLRVSCARDGKEMKRLLEEREFDLLVLDLMMPGEDGLTLCRELRAKSSLPIIMLTAMGEETDRIIGLEMGADDYLAKPFNPRELLARIKAVMRRTQVEPQPAAETLTRDLRFDRWLLDINRRELVDEEGVGLSLSTAEFDLLRVFLERPQRVLSRDQLLDLARGREAVAFDRAIDTLVSRLRRKLERDPKNPELIKTIWGGGYLFAADVTQV
ncbi:Transcriptional regulatory protein OmpR [Aeromonas hydrophila]|jgi:two-component system OmpR family response regulator|uniref:DNA-binding response regulator n=3 Tax=Aeromonas hydrophila TaxID=644 RepID=A0KQ49_AERHH|nr:MULTISPECIES: response regulator [Aeromonas]GKQ63676.1 DNA-binding response regulator [Aeromonas caviae]ABK39806.1 DNA-binding response regulator [Aeromonas hydrophila subsp. hydrophila ATCC 7966]AGM45951.1 DNA-binding response regulator [Aeromonas hydrophila ML09-119]AHX34563.1 chemotaxis protein CheY [Aeromonas hydrophila subsp. hydrophila AL09-71]AHX71363.1 chemotaxis protein CheY [Aeromonas hydrophila pc104A]